MNRGSIRACCLGLPGSARFNEAPIHESGKSDGPERPGGEAVDASMRPRFMNRGSATVTRPRPVGHTWLQ